MENILFNNDTFTIDPNLSWRDVGEDLVALNTSSGEYFTFNKTGRIIWLAIAEGDTLDELTQKIVTEYNVDQKKTLSDVTKFLTMLIEGGLIESS